MTNSREPMALIYNQSRSVNIQIPFSQVEHMFEEHEIKIYAKARIFAKQLIIVGKATEQDW